MTDRSAKSGTSAPRTRWTINEVTDVQGPALVLRCYYEHRDLRRCLERLRADPKSGRAADIGCGYGRNSMVLKECFAQVTGYEREAELVGVARLLMPGISFQTIDSLDRIPVPDGHFDFGLVFTVIQHLDEEEAKAVLQEAKRVVGRGHILLVEETDPSLYIRNTKTDPPIVAIGRSVDTYRRMMTPFELLLLFSRHIEPRPDLRRRDFGTYMLFRRS